MLQKPPPLSPTGCEPPTDSVEEALILILAIRNELDRGTLHYNKAGKLLLTALEIAQCIVDEGRVEFEPTPDRLDDFKGCPYVQ